MVDGLYGTIHTPYAVFSDDMYDGITEVKKQVKDTTMILNSIASGDNVCASADYQKNRANILHTGISLYEYKGKQSTHGKSIVIEDDIADVQIRIPDIADSFTVFPIAAILQLIAYYASVGKNLDVDQPRNLAKSVTVE